MRLIMARNRDYDDEDEDFDDRPKRGKKKDKDEDPNRPRNDAYTGMLVITFLVLVAASVFMYLDHEELIAAPVSAPKFEVPALGAVAPIAPIVPPTPPTPPEGGNPMPMPQPTNP
jgi:hypothetical protein